MNGNANAELIWFRRGGQVRFAVKPLATSNTSNWPLFARFAHGGAPVAIVTRPVSGVIYRCPTTLKRTASTAIIGDVFAILAGESRDGFSGARLNFRDILNEAKKEPAIMYVLAAPDVTDGEQWMGYVRLGHRKWVRLPVPLPQAVYNRIPTRALERRKSAVQAMARLTRLGIPVFNPSYFNKATIYDLIRKHELEAYLPETKSKLDASSLFHMAHRHKSVYLKPAGGSVGHGMMRIDQAGRLYEIAVLKNGKTERYTAASDAMLWQAVKRHRVPGAYVIQQAIPLIAYRGNPCDFRVLLQKTQDHWTLVGRGVRVSGKGRITTHVPNGGSIANADDVLREAFGMGARTVDAELESFVLRAAEAIDEGYSGHLGEMSMDIGIDAMGKPWFFEANAKPMKFDEPDIRSRSLKGILEQLHHRAHR